MGTLWPNSNSLEFNGNGKRAGGALARFYQGSTTTPLTVYTDAAETTPHPAAVPAAASGRWPSVFIPYTASYSVKVTTSTGTQLYYVQGIPNPNPVTAAEDTVDENQLIQTGFVVWSPESSTKAGFVRLNGRTIGNAVSGASERANADTEDLFTFCWDKLGDDQCPVSTGRGATAAADFAAGKTLTLLDGRRSILGGLDGMGNTAASGFTGVTFVNGDATTPGSVAGANTTTLTEAQLAAHTHSFSTTTGAEGAHTHSFSATSGAGGGHSHTGTTAATSHSHGIRYNVANTGGDSFFAPVGNTFGPGGTTGGEVNSNVTEAESAHVHTFTTSTASDHTHSVSGTTGAGASHTHSVSGTTGSTGSGSAVPITQRTILGTFYQKL